VDGAVLVELREAWDVDVVEEVDEDVVDVVPPMAGIASNNQDSV
jgi:hypothetical protein